MDNALFDKITTGDFYSRFFSFCKAVGVSRVNVEYSGGGDSGGTDHIEVILNKKIKKTIDPKIKSAIEGYIREELEEELSNPIYNRHGSFADGGGYSVNGVVVYDADGGRAWIEGTDHYYEWEESEDGEDEGEENCRDEAWDEMLYQSEEEGKSNERDYSFAADYVKITGTKLPAILHNHMAAAAIADDEAAQRYMAWCEKN